MNSYDDVADMFEKIADQHDHVADVLRKRDDPHYSDANNTLADAEIIHAQACRRAAMAMRGRQPIRRPA